MGIITISIIIIVTILLILLILHARHRYVQSQLIEEAQTDDPQASVTWWDEWSYPFWNWWDYELSPFWDSWYPWWGWYGGGHGGWYGPTARYYGRRPYRHYSSPNRHNGHPGGGSPRISHSGGSRGTRSGIISGSSVTYPSRSGYRGGSIGGHGGRSNGSGSGGHHGRR